MKRTLLFVGLAVGVGELAPPAQAVDLGLGIFNRRKAKADAPSKLKQAVATLQSDPDDAKRKAAVEELATFDPRNNPDVLPALAAALQKDPAPEVRIQAVEALGKLKPVNQQAGLAMEAAQGSDPNAKVREAINAALWQYHLAGYRTAPVAAGVGNPLNPQQSGEPPLAARPMRTTVGSPTTGNPAEVRFRPITVGVGKPIPFTPTAEPPLAKPAPTPAATVKPTPAPVLNVPSAPVAAPTVTIPTVPGLPPVAIPSIPTPPGLPPIPPAAVGKSF